MNNRGTEAHQPCRTRQEVLGKYPRQMLSENGHGTLAYSRLIMVFPRNGEIGLQNKILGTRGPANFPQRFFLSG